MIFKLLGNHVERYRNDAERDSSAHEPYDHGRDRGESRPKYRNYFENGSDDRKHERVRHVENSKPEKNNDAHDDRKQKLPLHPKADFMLRPLP